MSSLRTRVMRMTKDRVGFLAAALVAGAAVSGCSSSTGAGPSSDAGVEGGIHEGGIHRIIDGATGDDGSAPLVFDGTTGQACHANSDCVGPDGGAGLNVCSIGSLFDISGVKGVQLTTTPVCIVRPAATGGNCDPAPAGDPQGSSVHFCDGPDQSSSPGLCVAATSPPAPGLGTCLPKCTFGLDGTPATGCVGKAACQPITFTLGAQSGAITGYGVCQGYCQADADCTPLGAGYVCQTDIGFCTKTKTTRTKQPGDACSTAGATVPCNCVTGATSTAGYCTTTCVVGGASCPTGFVCDNGTPSPLDFGTGTTYPVTAQNPGTQGFCAPACSLADAGSPAADSGAAVDAGSAPDAAAPSDAGPAPEASVSPPAADGGAPGKCPAPTTCQAVTAAGADCQP